MKINNLCLNNTFKYVILYRFITLIILSINDNCHQLNLLEVIGYLNIIVRLQLTYMNTRLTII